MAKIPFYFRFHLFSSSSFRLVGSCQGLKAVLSSSSALGLFCILFLNPFFIQKDPLLEVSLPLFRLCSLLRSDTPVDRNQKHGDLARCFFGLSTTVTTDSEPSEFGVVHPVCYDMDAFTSAGTDAQLFRAFLPPQTLPNLRGPEQLSSSIKLIESCCNFQCQLPYISQALLRTFASLKSLPNEPVHHSNIVKQVKYVALLLHQHRCCTKNEVQL